MSDLPPSVVTLIGELIENFAFLIPTGTCEAPDPRTWDVLLSVNFTQFGSDCRGRVLIALTESASAEAARNILGLNPDQPVDASARRDAAGELANIIAGNILPHLIGEGDGFDLAQPAQVPAQDLVNGIFLDLGDGILGVAVES